MVCHDPRRRNTTLRSSTGHTSFLHGGALTPERRQKPGARSALAELGTMTPSL